MLCRLFAKLVHPDESAAHCGHGVINGQRVWSFFHCYHAAFRSSLMNFYLVDDDPDILAVLSRSLEAAGHRVEASPSSLQALKQIPMSRPDCVITDIMMPDMDGFELTRELRRRPELADMKIIVLSAKTYDFDRRRARQPGAGGLGGGGRVPREAVSARHAARVDHGDRGEPHHRDLLGRAWHATGTGRRL